MRPGTKPITARALRFRLEAAAAAIMARLEDVPPDLAAEAVTGDDGHRLTVALRPLDAPAALPPRPLLPYVLTPQELAVCRALAEKPLTTKPLARVVDGLGADNTPSTTFKLLVARLKLLSILAQDDEGRYSVAPEFAALLPDLLPPPHVENSP